MRNPGSSDAGDARPDRTDVPLAAEAGDVGGPADGDAALTHAPDRADAPTAPDSTVPADDELPGDELPHDELPHDELPHDIAAVPDCPGDDLLFDPLLCDEPIDLAAVRADDALIDALGGGGDLDLAYELIDADDPLIAMLAAWAASTRPDEEPEPERRRPPLTLVGAPDDGTRLDEAEAGETRPREIGPGETAEVVAGVDPSAGALDTGPGEQPDGPTPLVAVARAVVEAPAAVAPLGPGDSPADAPAASAPAADAPASDAPATGDPATDPAAPAPLAAVRRLVPAPVRGVLDRARNPRPLTVVPRRRPLPPGAPLRRAAVAVVIAALGVSGAAAAGGTARPGEPGFAMTRVFFAERAKSLEAVQVVSEGLARAKVYLAQRQPDLAAQELAAVENHLPDVRDEEGRTLLVDQQKVLADAVALTPPDPRGPRTPTAPTAPGLDRDTSVLAEAPPTVPPPDASTPAAATPGGADVATSPSEDAASAAAPDEGSGPADTPSQVETSAVSGTLDEGTVTADPTPTSGAGGDDGTTSGSDGGASGSADDTTTVTATSEPTDPTTTTSRTAEPTTSSTPKAPSSTRTSADDTGTVATGSVPAGGAPIAVRPVAHHEPAGEPTAQRDGHTGSAAHTAGSATAARSDDSADDNAASAPVARAVVPEPVAHPAPVVVTTVPPPVRSDPPADASPTGTKADDTKTKAAERPDRRHAKGHGRSGATAVAGARLSGVEVHMGSRAGAEISRAR